MSISNIQDSIDSLKLMRAHIKYSPSRTKEVEVSSKNIMDAIEDKIIKKTVQMIVKCENFSETSSDYKLAVDIYNLDVNLFEKLLEGVSSAAVEKIRLLEEIKTRSTCEE